MAKKNQPSSKEKTVQATSPFWRDRYAFGALLFIVALTIIAFQPLFDEAKSFLRWDDKSYIVTQTMIHSLTAENVAKIFDTESVVVANYHPLTMLSLAIDIERGGLSMRPIMQTSLLLHVINTVLVFVLIYRLFRQNVLIASIVTLVFAVHPMHVESVAWASARKDVLYACFYLMACLSYLRYTATTRLPFLLASYALFVMSCLSKPMAVTLPIVLLLVDLYTGRFSQLRSRAIIEKVPMLLIALGFGLLTISVQAGAAEGLVDTQTFSFGTRLIVAGYGICQYALKLIVPTGLSAYYPYPSDFESYSIPMYMIIGAVVVMASVLFVGYQWLRGRAEEWKAIAFGVFFFLITASVILQVVSVGAAFIADRYTYVPYLGLAIILAVIMNRLAKQPGVLAAAFACVAIVGCYWGWLSNQRIAVWMNTESLWTDVIQTFPFEFQKVGDKYRTIRRGSIPAYSNRALHYMQEKQYRKAADDFAVLYRANVKIKNGRYMAFYGSALLQLSEFEDAINAYDRAILEGDKRHTTYRSRGYSYVMIGRYAEGIADYQTSLQLKPDDQLTKQALAQAQRKLERASQ